MRIGTWNVEYGVGPRNTDRIRLLRDHGAHIWVLTETHSDLDLSATHTARSAEPRPGTSRRQGSSWVTIWSRYPLIRALPVPDPRRMLACLFATPVGELAVAGVVLPWQFDRGDIPTDPPPKNWAEHRRVIRHELPLLLESMRREAPNTHRVLAGDFNTTLAPPHYYSGIGAVRDEFNQLLRDESLTCHTATQRDPDGNSKRTLIDHICTSWERCLEITAPTGENDHRPELSDHPCVVVTFPD